MEQEEFKKAVGELLDAYKITDHRLFDRLAGLIKRYKLSKPNSQEHLQFILNTTVELLLKIKEDYSQDALLNLVIKIVSILETNHQELQKLKNSLANAKDRLNRLEHEGIAAYIGVGRAIIGSNAAFKKLFNFSRTNDYEAHVKTGHVTKTREEMKKLQTNTASIHRNYFITLSSNNRLSLGQPISSFTTIVPEWHSRAICDQGDVAPLFFQGYVQDRTLENKLHKLKENTTQAINQFITVLLTKTKPQSDFIKQAAIISALNADNLNPELLSEVNLLDTFNLLIELGRYFLHKEIDYQFKIDLKVLKITNFGVASALLQLVKDAICSVYNNKLKMSISEENNQLLFAIAVSENDFLLDLQIFDTTPWVFGATPYLEEIQQMLLESNTTLKREGDSTVVLSTPVTNAGLLENFVCFYPNKLTEKLSFPYKNDLQEMLQESIRTISGIDTPLQPSLFHEVRGELCALLANFHVSLHSPRDNDPDLVQNINILHQLISIHGKGQKRHTSSFSRNTEDSITEQSLSYASKELSPYSRKISNNQNKLSRFSRDFSPKRFFRTSKPKNTARITSPTKKPALYSSEKMNAEENSQLLIELTAKLVPSLVPPPKLIHYYRQLNQKNEENIDEVTVKPLQELIEILSFIMNQLENLAANKTEERLYYCIKTLRNIYKEFTLTELNEMTQLLETGVSFPALLTGPKLGARWISQNDARKLLGIDARGLRGASFYTGASHFVIHENGVHYKLDSRSGLATGIEQFVQLLLMESFPKIWPNFLTPTTLLQLSDTYTDKQVELDPIYIHASLTVQGILLSDWLIIKEWTDVLEERVHKDGLIAAIKSWISEEYIGTQSIDELYKAFIQNQQMLKPEERLEELIGMIEGDVSDRIGQDFRKLLEQEGEENTRRLYAFILKWPELVAGLRLFEVAKWIPLFNRLPELFLRISKEKMRPLIENNDPKLNLVTNKIYEELPKFWDLLDVPSTVALAMGCQIINFEDGKADNFQVCFEWSSPDENKDLWYTIKRWQIKCFDFGDQVLEHDIVAEKPSYETQLSSNSKSLPVKHWAGMKCILFFLPPLQNALPINFFDSAENLLLHSLELTQQQDLEYAKLQRMQYFTPITGESGLGIPREFGPFDLPRIYNSLKKMQIFMERNPKGTWKDLFSYTHPLLAKAYQTVYNQFPTRPTKAYIRMTKTCLEDILPLDEIWVEPMDLALPATDPSSPLVRLFKKSSSQSLRSPRSPQSGSPRSPQSSSPRSSQSGSPRLPSPRHNIRDELLMPAYNHSSRLLAPKEFKLESALVRIAKRFPWKTGLAEAKLSWLASIIKIAPTISLTHLELSLNQLGNVLVLAISSENKAHKPVVTWLIDQRATVDLDQLQLEMTNSLSESSSTSSTDLSEFNFL